MSNVPFAILYGAALSLFLIFPLLFRKKKKIRDSLLWVSIVASSLVLVFCANALIKKFRWEYGSAEVKSYLSSIHGAQVAYKKAWGNYSNDLTKLDLRTHQGELKYFTGLSAKCSGAMKIPAELPNVSPQIKKVFADFSCIDSSMKEKFEVFSVADLGGDQLDIWKINQDKQLFHLQDGRIPLNSSSMFDFR